MSTLSTISIDQIVTVYLVFKLFYHSDIYIYVLGVQSQIHVTYLGIEIYVTY